MCDYGREVENQLRRELYAAEEQIKQLESIIARIVVEMPCSNVFMAFLSEKDKELANKAAENHYTESRAGV